ncbi:ribosomal RNA-processing protein 8 [Eurosta solidaginis]|uniref:ribosomal RNA-processing protein 8 n=1 Tax=Eurosta solidaginis TaxID=178769 RepID=UPI003530FA77
MDYKTMSKFFVPMSWEDLSEAMRFRSKVSLGPSNADISAVQNKNAKLKKKKNKSTTQANIAGASSSKSILKVKKSKSKSRKVLNGKIAWPKSTKSPKPLSKVMIAPVPSLALPVPAVTSATKLKSKKSKQKNRKQQTTDGGGDEIASKSSNSKTSVKSTSSKTSILPPETPTKEEMNSDESVDQSKSEDIGLKVFENSLKHQLLAGRFRYINEQLYTMDSTQAEELFKSDAEAFEAYHAGYQQQVEKWPMNPLDRIIKMIYRLPKTLEIADFGCGEGNLAKLVPNKVYSMDLVSTRDDIIACDMACTPLPDQSVDIAVYCLSLMGTNLKEYLLEANRVLRMSGIVLIAEIQSRFDDLRNFIRGLQACGFELIKKDTNEQLFYFFQFKKVRNVGKVALIPEFSLKPCLYRKR